MEVAPYERTHLSGDVVCMNCGAVNIHENIICGRCGSNLPLVYGADGKPRIVTDDIGRYSTMAAKSRGGGFLSDPAVRGVAMRWFLRFGVVLAALIIAVWMLSRR